MTSRELIIYVYSKGYRVTENGVLLNPKCKILSPRKTGAGYVAFGVKNKEVGHKNVEIHRLAAYQWFGGALFVEGIQVRHLDGNCLNNSKENIGIGTSSQNQFDKAVDVRLTVARKAARVQRKLSDSEASDIRRKYFNGHTYKDLSIEYGLAKSTVYYIVKRRTYR